MIFGKTACVIEMFAVFHILVNIVSLNLQQKIVHIGADEFPLFAVPGFERVVIKSYIRILLFLRIDIPTYTGLSSFTLSLRMLTPTRLFVNCVHPVNKGLVINLQSFPFHHYELFFCLCVSACSPLFTKHRIVHELVEVFLKIVCCVLSEFCIFALRACLYLILALGN